MFEPLMSNSYSQWNQFNFPHPQLEHDLDYNLSVPTRDSQQQQRYQYSQNPTSSSLHDALMLTTQPSSHSIQNIVNRNYVPNPHPNQLTQSTTTSNSYHLSDNFNFSSNAANTSSLSQQQHRVPHYPPSNGQPITSHKRPRGAEHRNGLSPDDTDLDLDLGPSEQKDAPNKSKLPRACARCKRFKVRCEAKTEVDPCKRCLSGGHECVIPGRTIRRTPPKREHLLSRIQSQAQEIESLMQQLAEVTASASNKQNPPNMDTMITDTELLSLSFGSDAGSDLKENNHVTPTDKAVADWIAKARQSFDQFGALVGIGGAPPQSYLIQEDYEETDSSDEDEFVDVSEELDGYGFAVEEPDSDDMKSEDVHRPLRHKSSASSSGTSNRKAQGDLSRPANLPVPAAPFGLFGKLILSPRSRANSAERDDEDKGPGIANADFFKPAPVLNPSDRQSTQYQAPYILTRGVITPQEAEKLFDIYFHRMNLSVSLLDPVLYTAQRTFYRSPFLFTVICAIASRFFTERPGIYSTMMQYAKLAAGTALISGNKNVEMCHAYILLSVYPVPVRKWEDQRSWLYLGLAIRTATDLSLHLPMTAKPLHENHAREMLNRTRAWMNCLNVERSTASQYGKPPIIDPKDYILNHSDDWWRSSPYNMKHFDIHLCVYSGELKVIAGFLAKIYSNPNHPTGLNKEVDFEKIAAETDDELKAHEEKWLAILKETDMTDPQNCFRTGLLRLAHSYARLVALSYGFQHAFRKNAETDENPFLMRCLGAASDVVHVVVDDICRPNQRPYFRHGPEAQSVFVTFASAFLVKLLQPKFAFYLTQEQRVNIRTLVQSVIDLLGSPEIAVDDRHGPKLYSRFLQKLLERPMAKLDLTSPSSSTNALPPTRAKSSRPPRLASGPGYTNSRAPSEYHNVTVDYPSPSTSSSLSPPATEAALSFDTFAPVGGIDPFSANMPVTSPEPSNLSLGELFQPSLPFDEDIMQSMQSMTDPNAWQDISLPGFNWMTQFQENLGMNMNDPATFYDSNMTYLTGSER